MFGDENCDKLTAEQSVRGKLKDDGHMYECGWVCAIDGLQQDLVVTCVGNRRIVLKEAPNELAFAYAGLNAGFIFELQQAGFARNTVKAFQTGRILQNPSAYIYPLKLYDLQ